MRGWIGVDLDGTLAAYGGWRGPYDVGDPIPAMMERVKKWIAEGKEVRIFTSRAAMTKPEELAPVRKWLQEQGIGDLVITNIKDFEMIELWDDRCVHVEVNTGRVLG